MPATAMPAMTVAERFLSQLRLTWAYMVTTMGTKCDQNLPNSCTFIST